MKTMKTKRNILLHILIITITGVGILSITSCKRGTVQDPNPSMHSPAGFRISLSGTANPSTLYVPENQPAVSSRITVRALNNDGTAAANYNVVFEESGGYGYFQGYEISVVRTTDGNGVAWIDYFIPSGAGVTSTVMTNIRATLVDDGRLDNIPLSQIYDIIPIRIIPYTQQGILLEGYILTQGGNGVEGIIVALEGTDTNISGVDITRTNGRYKFYVPGGWYGSIIPSAVSYSFTPISYIFTENAPVYADRTDLDFIALFATGNTLATDVNQYDAPVEGGTQPVNVYNPTGDVSIGYSVFADTPWINLSTNFGSTPGNFTITVEENLTGLDRTGTVTITATDTVNSSVTITINQASNEVPSGATLAADITTLNVDYPTSDTTINVYNSTTSDSIAYLITPNVNWLTVSKNAGSTADSFTLTVDDNYGVARTGTVTLTPTSTGVTNTVTITVNQEAGPSLAVTPGNYSALAAGGETFTVTVTNPTNSDVVEWIADTDTTWLGFFPNPVPPTGFTGGSFTVEIQTANPGTATRIGVVTVYLVVGGVQNTDVTATVTVAQAGS